MGTRAVIAKPVDYIGVINPDITVECISIGSDGYPSNIFEKMRSLIKDVGIEVIMAGGDISNLGNRYHPNPLGYHDSEYPQLNTCIVLARDNKRADPSQCEMKCMKIRDVKSTYGYADYLYVIDNEDIHVSSLIDGDLKFQVNSWIDED